MKYEESLNKYRRKGSFIFTVEDNFAKVCNAPRDFAGIYLIYEGTSKTKNLIYIGISGRRGVDGEIIVRQGGLYDRLVNGYHPNRFGESKRIKRRTAFPLQMKSCGIQSIEVKWWVTYDQMFKDFPSDVEGELLEKYLLENGCKPKWHS
ncbi:hypothetical protein CSC80_03565 [Maribacter sp. 6B07]|uniref:hypothetical protein n=1 Tax=Maribacter sp. 6B07 TaxID=2045442 RepID=UPI000C069154|nr:hypothetical protein [Maribacter sp. 6B07]PHN94444.1 hypothetical protein CSC80_03565 [Maribacter sp. 6B07]